MCIGCLHSQNQKEILGARQATKYTYIHTMCTKFQLLLFLLYLQKHPLFALIETYPVIDK